MNAIFARTRHHYDSYTDFWRLVEASKFPTCYLDEIDLSQPVAYITTPANGDTRPAVAAARASAKEILGKVIWWNLERPIAELGADLDQAFRSVDAIWASDESFAARDSRMLYVPMGGHPGIAHAISVKKYDVCHLSYLWGRRLAVVNELRARGVTIAPEAWGAAEQDKIVGASRLMLSMHQYADAAVVAPIRVAVAASYHLPVVTEALHMPWSELLEARYERIADVVVALLADPASLRRYADRLHDRLCVASSFPRAVDDGVARTNWKHAAR